MSDQTSGWIQCYVLSNLCQRANTVNYPVASAGRSHVKNSLSSNGGSSASDWHCRLESAGEHVPIPIRAGTRERSAQTVCPKRGSQ
jgi:hypothetical protein